MDVLHAALWVTDLETEIEFYESVLGLSYSRDFEGVDGETNHFLSGESDAEIQFKYDESLDLTVDSGTVDHVAVAVEDVDATVELAVEEWGSELVGGPRTVEDNGVRIAFITDPEGYRVELIEHL